MSQYVRKSVATLAAVAARLEKIDILTIVRISWSS
jgi:hypothetical protein